MIGRAHSGKVDRQGFNGIWNNAEWRAALEPPQVIVAILAMTGHRVQSLNGAMETWIELALSLPVVIWAGRPNCLGVPLAAGVLYPHHWMAALPMIAALAMSLSSVSVITNALRLGRAHRG
jgi:cation transport ATPase